MKAKHELEKHYVMSDEDFDETLILVLKEELGITDDSGVKILLSIPGIYEILSEHYNNEVFDVAEINQCQK